jgi:RNA ligase (TIGR02306 family)
MRKLATIETLHDVRPHPNADSLELATIRGWQVVVKRGEFQSGDRCVYCEIDSVLPDRSEFQFLRDRKFRIKTIKLRGELSQGICFPITILNSGSELRRIRDQQLSEGSDVTELLGVTRYQPPIPACLGGNVEGSFPSFIPKTDCERIQNH